MSKLISKELFFEVTGLRINSNYYGVHENTIEYDENKHINTYELAHKCKEWAWQNGHIITSFPTKAYWRVIADSTEMFIMESELEAVFKACQWILDNKDKQ